MSARLRGIAQETERIVAAGAYRAPDGRLVDIAAAVGRARAGTRLYGPRPVPVEAPSPGVRTVFEVTAEGSLTAGRRLAGTGEGPLAVLNFASARNPGGGYLNGAQAQEEALCRGSALYTCVREAPDFYAAHRADPSPFYSDRVILSPGVPVFRDDRGTLLDVPYEAGFLTAAAPNAGVIARQRPDETGRVAAALAVRAERVLEVAAAGGHRQLVLGAWGCGVFRNEPAEVARAFAAALLDGGRFTGWFDRMVFAVLDRREDSPTRAAFSAVFAA